MCYTEKLYIHQFSHHAYKPKQMVRYIFIVTDYVLSGTSARIGNS